MIVERNNIMELIKKSNSHPSKDYGQNFLIDPLLAKKIVDALDIKENDFILEIGPGLGSLTHFLYDKTKNLTLIDIDSRMTDFCKIIYPNAKIINNDIRKEDVSNFNKIIANLPYNITTEVLTYLLLNAKNVSKMTLMCQLEAFNHIFDTSKSEYGPLSVLAHLLGKIEKVLTLKPGSFIPTPKCTSIVFNFQKNKLDNDKDIIGAYYLAKALFLNRRKTIFNNLNHYLKNKDRALEIIKKLNIKENSRPEEILPEIYLKMYKNINN